MLRGEDCRQSGPSIVLNVYSKKINSIGQTYDASRRIRITIPKLPAPTIGLVTIEPTGAIVWDPYESINVNSSPVMLTKSIGIESLKPLEPLLTTIGVAL